MYQEIFPINPIIILPLKYRIWIKCSEHCRWDIRSEQYTMKSGLCWKKKFNMGTGTSCSTCPKGNKILKGRLFSEKSRYRSINPHTNEKFKKTSNSSEITKLWYMHNHYQRKKIGTQLLFLYKMSNFPTIPRAFNSLHRFQSLKISLSFWRSEKRLKKL